MTRSGSASDTTSALGDRSSDCEANMCGQATLLAYDGLAGNDVVKSQVLGLAAALVSHVPDVRVIVFERLGRFRQGRQEGAQYLCDLNAAGIELTVVPRLPGPPGLFIARAFATLLLYGRKGVVHCRGAKGVYVGSTLLLRRPFALVGDFRGAEAEEARDLIARGVPAERGMRLMWGRRFADRLERLEKKALETCDHAFCVSGALVEYFVTKYGLARQRFSVVHCSASPEFHAAPDRDLTRVSHGFRPSDRVVCYVGRLSPVHRPELIASLIRSMASVSTHPIVALLVTRDAPVADQVRQWIGGAATVVSIAARHQDVPALVRAADAGLLVLDGAQRNALAFPVKFSEYVCSGLPVVATASSLDQASLIRELGLGILVAPQGDGWELDWPAGQTFESAVNDVLGLSPDSHERIAQRSAPIMRFDNTVLSVLSVYEAVLGESRRADRIDRETKGWLWPWRA